jgi:DNA (cytosine-5)-methyltransferase 1
VNVLDLFSGIGGFSLGLERAGMRTIAFAETDPFKSRVLAHRWPGVPNLGDVRGVRGIACDVACGGFPCQDISIAGRGAGLEGEQSGLWAEFARIVRESRPKFVIVENSPELLVRGMGRVLGDLADAGYDAEWEGIPAAAVGAPHLRARQWILAYPSSLGDRLQEDTLLAGWDRLIDRTWWSSEPGISRVDDGVPHRVDRCSATGDAILPQIAEIIGRAIMSLNRVPNTTNKE